MVQCFCANKTASQVNVTLLYDSSKEKHVSVPMVFISPCSLTAAAMPLLRDSLQEAYGSCAVPGSLHSGHAILPGCDLSSFFF